MVYEPTFNIKLLNKINLLEHKIADSSDEDIKKRFEIEKEELLKHFLIKLKKGDFVTLKDSNQERVYLEQTKELWEANQEGDSLALMKAQLNIYTIFLERTFEIFLITVHDYYSYFKPHSSFTKLFISYSESTSFDSRAYKRVYDKIVAKKELTSEEMEYVEAYERFEDKYRVYQEVFFLIVSDVNKTLETNALITEFGIENLIVYLDENDMLSNYNDLSKKYLSITIGQLIVAFGIFGFILLLKTVVIDSVLYALVTLFRGKNEKDRSKDSRFKSFLDSALRDPIRYIIYLAALDFSLRVVFMQENNQAIVSYFTLGYILLFVWGAFKFINNFVLTYSDNVLERYPNVRGEMVNFFVNLSKILVVIIGILIVLSSMGYDVSGIVASLGIGGLAVAFAARETIANIFGSISVILDNIFTQGDWVVVDGVEGTVVDIGMRSTKIRTFDNSMIYVPNSTMASAEVRNWSKRILGRRIYMKLGATYDSDPKDLENAVLQIREMLVSHPDIADDSARHEMESARMTKVVSRELEYGIKKTLLVYIDSFESSSIDILVYCFSKTVDWQKWLEVKQDVILKIMYIFEANNLSFAFPSQSVYWKNESEKPLEILPSEPELITPKQVEEMKK
jgi:MscS family membrane protein